MIMLLYAAQMAASCSEFSVCPDYEQSSQTSQAV